MFTQLQVGPQVVNDGSTPIARGGKTGELVSTNLHGLYYEQNYRGNLYSWGKTITALSANSITLVAATTPIIGVWNASTTVNLVVLQAALQIALLAASSTTQGAFVWATSVGNTAISTGNAPFNRKTLTNAGSQAKGFDLATALTGLTNNLVIQESADFGGGLAISTTSITAATPVPTYNYTQYFDGTLIVPPGGVLALLNTNSTTNVSVASRILWEEVSL